MRHANQRKDDLISLSHYEAATRATAGYVTGLHLAISVPLLGCTAVADDTHADAHTGLVAASYSDNTHVLSAMSAGNGLRVYDVRHCDGLIKNSDAVVLGANYALRPY
jgi:hypothetical protein